MEPTESTLPSNPEVSPFLEIAGPPVPPSQPGLDEAIQAAPSAATRLHSLDLLRGIAVLMILPANMPHYSGSRLEGVAGGSESFLDQLAVSFTLFFVDGKFITLLSILFGAGLAIQVGRAGQAIRAFDWYYLRRMALLFGIGLVHALFLFFGDILTSYAIVGAVALFMNRLGQRGLLWGIGVCLAWSYFWLTIFTVAAIVFAGAFVMPGGPAPGAEPADEITERLQQFFGPENQVRIQQEGAFVDLVLTRGAYLAFYVIVFWLVLGWYILACFLLGAWLLRRGVFQHIDANRSLLVRFIVLGLGLGIPLHLAAVVAYVRDPQSMVMMFVATLAALPQALAYLAMLLLWSRTGRLAWLQALLRAAGRLALTNYLMQSVICCFLFTGLGLGLYARLGPFEALAVVAAIWLFELALSPLWLRFFQIGPVEWAWRSLAEGKPRPFLRTA